ncbi:MAG: septal ring lytic transglycosylase RlpA family protein [Pseudomonadota bacterium]
MSATTTLVAACGALTSDSGKVDPQYGVAPSPQLADKRSPIPKGGGVYKVGRPYQIAGNWYYPREDANYDSIGIASWYGDDFHGRQTANGEVFDMNALTAAHPTLPMPTYARVTNLENGRSIVVRVNDRGPFARGREIDLSRQAAKTLGMKHQGTAKVRVQYVGRARIEGSDDNWLRTTYVGGGATGNEPLSQLAQASESQGQQTGLAQSQLALAQTPAPQVRPVQTQIIRPLAAQPFQQPVAGTETQTGFAVTQQSVPAQNVLQAPGQGPVQLTTQQPVLPMPQPVWQQSAPVAAPQPSPVATQVAPAYTSSGVVPGLTPPSSVSGFAAGFFSDTNRIDAAFQAIERQTLQPSAHLLAVPERMDPAGIDSAR